MFLPWLRVLTPGTPREGTAPIKRAGIVDVIRLVSYHFVITLWSAKETECGPAVKYWEIIADNLKRAGWSLGYVSAIDSDCRTIWIADAHRAGKRFIVRVGEKLTAFVNLKRAI
jgi:hypothetical protein